METGLAGLFRGAIAVALTFIAPQAFAMGERACGTTTVKGPGTNAPFSLSIWAMKA